MAWGIATMASSRTSERTHLGAETPEGSPRLGRKKTIVNVEPSILIAVRHILTDNVDDQDRGCDFFTERATFS